MAARRARALRTELHDRIATVLPSLRERVAGETLYAVALYTSGESDYSYVVLSANTEEALARTVDEHHATDPEIMREDLLRDLRWSTCDWAHHEIPEFGHVRLPPQDDRTADEDRAIYDAFVGALRAHDKAGAFGARAERRNITLNVVCGDMSEEFFRRGLELLNPRVVVQRYLAHFTPDALVREIDERPDAEAIWFALYEDVMLGETSRSGELAIRAQRRNLTTYELNGVLPRLPSAATRLLDLIERHGFAKIFNEKGSADFERDGAFTRAIQLATSAALLLGAMRRIDDATARRVQDLIARRVATDASLEVTTTLAENLARVLHSQRPRAFPPSELDPDTNKLVNASAFVPPNDQTAAKR